MGRTGSGVEVREKSIRLSFTVDGQPQRQTLSVDGKPLAPTPANVKYAHRLAAEIREKIRHGTFSMAEYFPAAGVGSTLTVGAQLDTWLAAQRVATSTKAGYSSACRFWKAASYHDTDTTLAFGDVPLRGVRHSQVLTALARRPELSGKTINNYVSVLREALQLAVVDKLLTSNPVDGVPRAAHQKDPPDPFTRDEAEAIILAMTTHHPEPVAAMTEFRFFTGLRTSELFGLRWPNVDLRSGSLLIAEALVRGESKDTKTSVARTVLLNSRALAAIQRQAKHTRLAGEHVWEDPRYGQPWTDERAYRRSYWEPTLKRLGVRYRRPYNTRHTYATMMLMAGMTPAFCAKQLGHSVEMFLATYSRWLDGQQNDLEMRRLESMLTEGIAKAV